MAENLRRCAKIVQGRERREILLKIGEFHAARPVSLPATVLRRLEV